MDAQKRTVVIRKANSLINDGDYENAELLCLASKYQDGLIKLADRHFKEQRLVRAYKLYKAAKQPDMIEKLLDMMAFSVQELLNADNETTPESQTAGEQGKRVFIERPPILGNDYMTKTKKDH